MQGLRGEIVEGFNLVLYEGGSIDDLEACADEVGVTALYTLDGGAYVSYLLGAPELVNAAFRELFGDGLPIATPLVGKRVRIKDVNSMAELNGQAGVATGTAKGGRYRVLLDVAHSGGRYITLPPSNPSSAKVRMPATRSPSPRGPA